LVDTARGRAVEMGEWLCAELGSGRNEPDQTYHREWGRELGVGGWLGAEFVKVGTEPGDGGWPLAGC